MHLDSERVRRLTSPMPLPCPSSLDGTGSQQACLAAMQHYREVMSCRDQIVLSAHGLGIHEVDIAKGMGHARNTIRQIIGKHLKK